ncbi:hypothetical protein Tco_1113419 [Tanacetum coccineum]|uniref:Uncharacterized protein n=1 Tax=Tanacetum coccineum TaxID=301880 RepID=A0ABQ5ITB6_9ASTR
MTRMTGKFVLLKEYAQQKPLEKIRGEEKRNDKTDETLDNTEKPIVIETEIPVMEAKKSNETKNKPIKKAERKEVEEVRSSRPVEYYLKHRINEKLIDGLFDIIGSDVNVKPYSTYMKLTDERPVETDIRLALASHSYIYPLGIDEDVLVEASPEMGRKDKTSLRKGDEVQPMEEQKFKGKHPTLIATKEEMDDEG